MNVARARTRIVVALVAGLIGAGLALPAGAAPTWVPVVKLSMGGLTVGSPSVAVDASGNSTAVWSFSSGADYLLQTASRPAGGAWSAPVTLAQTPDLVYPEIAVDPAGNVIAVWDRQFGSTSVVQAATRTLTGSWSTPVPLSSILSDSFTPQVAVDAAGTATVVWLNANFVQSRRKPLGANWSSSINLNTGAQPVQEPHVAVDPAGNATAVWVETVGGQLTIRAASRPAGGAWTPLGNLSDNSQGSSDPLVAVSPAGNATAVWQRSNGSHIVIQASERALGGAWSSPVNLSGSSQDAHDAQIGVDAAGNRTAIWTRSNGLHIIVQASTRPSGGNWSAPVNLSNAVNDASQPRLAVVPSGQAMAVWELYNGSHTVVQTSARPLDGAWSSALELSDPSTSAKAPSIAVDVADNATAVWARNFEGNQVFEARGLDGAGPRIAGFTAPAAAQTGQVITYAATATDVWSAVSSFTWDFGDGATASGATVSHSYGGVGTFAVTLTATDAVGNASTLAGSTKVTTTPPPPTPTITKLKLTNPKIVALSRAVPKSTKLKIGLSTAAKVKLVVKSKHRHLVNGKKKFVRAVLKKSLPAGLSKITMRAKVAGKRLRPDTYLITATARNVAGTSAKKKVKLVVVKP